jgi:hypothetical protein
MTTFEEFEKTVYYTYKKIVIPLLGLRIDKVDYLKGGKLDEKLIEELLLKLYEKNAKKFKN